VVEIPQVLSYSLVKVRDVSRF